MIIMRSANRRLLLCAMAGAALLSGCSSNQSSTPAPQAGAPAAGAGKTLEIAVIPKGETHEYWKSIHAGANKAKEELAAKGINIEILWKGPVREDDRNSQIDIVQTFVTQQVNGIVLAPLDNQALVAPVHDAVAQKIPVVVIDSDLNSTDPVSTVATNNVKGGELGAKRLLQVLGGKKRVLMMRYEHGSASTDQREQGFLNVITKAPGIQIVSDDQFAGATVDTAYKTAQNLLNRYGSQVDGIFCPNESSTRGMILAMKDAGLIGKIKLIGFDSSVDLDTALQNGTVQGLVVQDPVKMGYLGVITMVDTIQGKTVPKNVDTGVNMITPDNMNQPDMHALLYPPLDKYLK